MDLRRSRWIPLLLGGPLLFAGCEEVERIVDSRRALTPHEAYLEGLSEAGLAETALARAWAGAAEQAVSTPHAVRLPFQEEGYLPPEEPTAVGYRISLARGRVLSVRLDVEGGDSIRLFLDLFRVPDVPTDPLRPVLASDSVPRGLTYEPYRAGEYILRVQPELLRGGRYRLVLTQDPALAFPVQGVDERAVWSVFGDDRDGGRRRHNGVDIFAPRGTPALAAVDGEVYRVDTTSLGGKVVWIRDDVRNARVYYAHLDTQLVAVGARVKVGDIVGLVGNTGNARTTAPHLHFGLYSRGGSERGPMDPMPFIRPTRSAAPRLTADVALLGGWARVRDSVRVRQSPGEEAAVTAELSRHAPLRVMAGAGSWYRVALPDGRSGWVPVTATEAAGKPIRDWILAEAAVVRAGPHAGAPVMAGLDAGTALPVLGAFAGFAFVQMPAGRRGWVSEEG